MQEIFIQSFFCWFDKIYVKKLLTWLRFWAAGWRLSFWKMDTFWEFALIYCAPVSSCITSLLDMAFSGNWFIKITRSFGSGFQKQQIVKPNARLIIIENRSEQRFISDQIGNTLWFVKTVTHCFFCYFNSMLIVFLCQWNYMGLTFPGLGYYCYIPIEIHMQREALTILL